MRKPPPRPRLKLAFLGLSITSSWGNGHATTYRGLIRELARRGHDVLFLERDVPWYADNRDLPRPPYCRTALYRGLEDLRDRFASEVRAADFTVVGSYVPDGVAVGEWALEAARGPVAFYDIDTPVTLAKLARGDEEYLAARLIPRYALYLSFTGGPALESLEQQYGSPAARALYCSVDPSLYHPEAAEARWDLGYLGTYSADRQPALDRLLLEPARRWPEGHFAVVGPQYPDDVAWPANVHRDPHLAPAEHRGFYCRQRFTLNVTRADMVRAGYSPSVRLFEAAACGTPVVSDWWEGLDTLFEPGREILVSRSPEETLRYLREMPEAERRGIGRRARDRVLAAHTAAHRAAEFEEYVHAALARRAGRPRAVAARADSHPGG
jgi:spore maturation protein CgeB